MINALILSQPSQRTVRLVGLILALIATVFYLYTVCPTVVWVDGARLSALMYTLDLRAEAHSHPIYIIVGWLFMQLPVGDPGYRGNLVSVAMGVVVVVLSYGIAWKMTRNIFVSTLAGLAMIVTHYVWFHATIAEDVLTVSLFATLIIWLLLSYRDDHRPRWLRWAAFSFGLGLSTHLLVLLMTPALALSGFLWLWKRPEMRPKILNIKELALLAVLAGIGALPYVVLWVWSTFLAAENNVALGTGLQFAPAILYGLPRVPAVALVLFLSWPLMQFGAPFGFLAIWSLWRGKRWNQGWTLILASQICFFTFAVCFGVPDQYEFFTVCYVLFGAFIAEGLRIVFIGMVKWRVVIVRVIVTLLIVDQLAIDPLVFTQVWPDILKSTGAKETDVGMQSLPERDGIKWYANPNKRGDYSARLWGEHVLAQLPPNAIVVMNSPEAYDTGLVLEYFLGALHRRPDVTLVGTLTDNFIAPSVSLTAPKEERRAEFEALLKGKFSGHAVYFLTPPTDDNPFLPQLVIPTPRGYTTQQEGTIYKLVKSGK